MFMAETQDRVRSGWEWCEVTDQNLSSIPEHIGTMLNLPQNKVQLRSRSDTRYISIGFPTRVPVTGRIGGVAFRPAGNDGARASARPGRASLTQCRVMTAPPASSEKTGSPFQSDFRATVESNAPWSEDTAQNLFFKLIDRDTGAESAAIDLGKLVEPRNKMDHELGWKIRIPVTKVEGVKTPGAIVFFKKSTSAAAAQDYVSEVTLEMNNQEMVFPVYSWVSSEHGDRPFFTPTSYLPSNTPEGLKEARVKELQTIRGDNVSEAVRKAQRKGGDRIYDYQVYNDLGKGDEFREALGGTSVYPYPRRIATNRPTGSRGEEVAPEGGKPWLPYDEMFEFGKSAGFTGNAIFSAIPLIKRIISVQSGWEAQVAIFYGILRKIMDKLPFLSRFIQIPAYVDNFDDFRDCLNLYAMARGGVQIGELLPTELYPSSKAAELTPASQAEGSSFMKRFKKEGGGWDFTLGAKDADDAERAIASSMSTAVKTNQERAEIADYAPGKVGGVDVFEDFLRRLKSAGGVNKLLEFPVPRSLEGRPNEWFQDAEMGRQVLAGMNPCVVEALTPERWAAVGSAISEDHVKGQLQGSTIQSLLQQAAAGGKPRLFLIDYWALSFFWEDEKDKDNKVQHAGRCLFYLRKKEGSEEDEAFLPVAIELAHADTAKANPGLPATQGLVYTPKPIDSDEAAIWRLAKCVFRSLDSSYHQLISHWLRTHACLEPFHIAMQRNISKMHPVMRLMEPHFRYTLNINANARSSLINAGGVIEQNFTAGDYAMRLSSVVYKLKWRFAEQNLPTDLKKRGMVDPKGNTWMEYPYAQDGLDLHNAMAEYFGKYLDLYYKSDDEVAADEELQAWWEESKNKGHADWRMSGATEKEMWGFEGGITSKAQLVSVLVTIAWTASAHHAAVNFGQYDFAGLPLAVSSLVQKAMPAPGDAAYQQFIELSRSGARKKQEALFMSYLADVKAAVLVMVTIRLLSTHAEDEETLITRNKYIQDPAAVALNNEFIKKMQALEAAFNARNNTANSWARGDRRVNPDNMPYSLLLPSSPAGMTGRGVPYSVSI